MDPTLVEADTTARSQSSVTVEGTVLEVLPHEACCAISSRPTGLQVFSELLSTTEASVVGTVIAANQGFGASPKLCLSLFPQLRTAGRPARDAEAEHVMLSVFGSDTYDSHLDGQVPGN